VRAITTSYYRVLGIIIVYDISNRVTFNNVQSWLDSVDRYALQNVSIILVGNKIDRDSERQVPHAEGKEFADKLKIPFIETSAKTDTSVYKAFFDLVNEILVKVKETDLLIKPKTLNTQFRPSICNSYTCVVL